LHFGYAEQVNDFFNRPNMVCNSRFHRSSVTICSGLYLFIGIPAFLQSEFSLSHSRWYKKPRSRQPWLANRVYHSPISTQETQAIARSGELGLPGAHANVLSMILTLVQRPQIMDRGPGLRVQGFVLPLSGTLYKRFAGLSKMLRIFPRARGLKSPSRYLLERLFFSWVLHKGTSKYRDRN
jgi:hypothetical protein